MKIQSVDIQNLHNVRNKHYDFTDISYFIGKNGSGKSTILNGIQLGLLGYIPGYAKTNQAIYKHCNGLGPLSITVKLEDAGQVISISRTWMKSRSSVTCVVNVDPETCNLDTILGDIELPIFNWSDFTELSSNKLKDWFIKFLPANKVNNIDWKGYLLDSCSSYQMFDNSLLDSVVSFIDQLKIDNSQKLKQLNDHLKLLLSANKKSLERLVATTNSLVYYEDVDTTVDVDALKTRTNDIASLIQQYNIQINYLQNIARYESELLRTTEKLNSLKNADAYIDKQPELDEINSKMLKLQSTQSELNIRKKYLLKLANSNGLCPYTNNACQDIVATIESSKQELSSLESHMLELSAMLKDLDKKRSELLLYIKTNNNIRIETTQLESQIKTIKSYIDYEKSRLPLKILNIDECKELIIYNQSESSKILSQITKVESNLKFKKLSDDLLKEKYKIEAEIDCLKCWIKDTSNNALDKLFGENPLTGFETALSKNIKLLWGDDCEAVLLNNNTCEIGLKLKDSYIPYYTLSSGEKCLYQIAIMCSILMIKECDLKLIIIDDMLDHLDSDNINLLFEQLSNFSTIQFIFAGVNAVDNKNVIRVGGDQ